MAFFSIFTNDSNFIWTSYWGKRSSFLYCIFINLRNSEPYLRNIDFLILRKLYPILFWLCDFGYPVYALASKDFNIIRLSNMLALSVHDDPETCRVH
jgi:hypothetical protein